MTRIATAAPLIVLLAAPAMAQAPDDYLDDRSTAAQVVQSLYNALNRQEYLRAHSYFKPDSAPEYQGFRDGYADTASIRLRTGAVTGDGAAGTLHSAVPVAIEAVATDGITTVYQGCYLLSQVQPAAQEIPPFRPIAIDSGTLTATDTAFDDAMGTCPP